MNKFLLLDSGLVDGFLMSNASIHVNPIHKENKVLFHEDYLVNPLDYGKYVTTILIPI